MGKKNMGKTGDGFPYRSGGKSILASWQVIYFITELALAAEEGTMPYGGVARRALRKGEGRKFMAPTDVFYENGSKCGCGIGW